jgi:phage tail sheath protein FI
MAEYKTPGVYVVEKNAFTNSVVQVETAIPAFIGCTQKAARGSVSLLGKPTRISSLAEYNKLFGEGPRAEFSFTSSTEKGQPPFSIDLVPAKKYFFYNSMKLFFDNGGGACFIVSVGLFDEVTENSGMKEMSVKTLVDEPLAELEKHPEPTMIVIPDAVQLSEDAFQQAANKAIQHCIKMQNRMAILDIYAGDQIRTNDDDSDVINRFRNTVQAGGDGLNYGVAYYPWLNTSIVEENSINFSLVQSDNLGALVEYLKKHAGEDIKEESKLKKVTSMLDTLTESVADPDKTKIAHQALKSTLPGYQDVLRAMLEKANVLPPSAGIAGVYSLVDNIQGVYKAPANVPIQSVISPTVQITNDEQEDLNVPLYGKAVNAIRAFPGRGVLVWGARTLDGNSQDWRYVNVRRTMIMLEQSIKAAAETYMFAANTAQTWVTVKGLIVNFLTNQWKAGALQGVTPEDAFSVDVGLGSTMDGNDILDGYMRVSVKVALVHPAEFIVLTFQQQMAKS